MEQGIAGITTGDGDAAGEGALSCARTVAAHSEVTVASNTTHAGKHLSVIVPPLSETLDFLLSEHFPRLSS